MVNGMGSAGGREKFMSNLKKIKEKTMNTKVKIFLIVVCACFVCGCCPDLTVEEMSVVWDSNSKVATARIRNVGTADADFFMVYFDGVEQPESLRKRPQVTREVDGLAQGEWVKLMANFGPLADPANSFLANVQRIRVTADAKHMVQECNEGNNTREVSVP